MWNLSAKDRPHGKGLDRLLWDKEFNVFCYADVHYGESNIAKKMMVLTLLAYGAESACYTLDSFWNLDINVYDYPLL